MYFYSTIVKTVFVAACTVLLLGIPYAGAALQDVETIEKSFTTTGVPEIYVRNVDGRTRLTAHSGSDVQVRAIKQVKRADSRAEAEEVARQVTVHIAQVGDRIEVETKYPKNFSWGRGPQVFVHIEISAPERSNADVKSVDGDLTVSGIEGELQLKTVDGDLAVTDCSGDIHTNSVDGDAELIGVTGNIEARTVDGDLDIEGILRGVRAKSTDGDVAIRVRSASVMDGDWSVTTSDGSIRLEIPEGFGANLDVRVDDGSIESDHPLTLEGKISNNRFQGELYGGGHQLHIRTSDGSVELKKSSMD
jgi:hypothetical protein